MHTIPSPKDIDVAAVRFVRAAAELARLLEGEQWRQVWNAVSNVCPEADRAVERLKARYPERKWQD